MGHLDSQRSLPVVGGDRSGFSAAAKKLRLAPGQRVAVVNAPAGYVATLSPGPSDLTTDAAGQSDFDVVQVFVGSVEELRRLGPSAIAALKPAGLLWVTYAKNSASSPPGDLPATASWSERDVLGEITGVAGYRPVAMVSIDPGYTALRFKRV